MQNGSIEVSTRQDKGADVIDFSVSIATSSKPVSIKQARYGVCVCVCIWCFLINMMTMTLAVLLLILSVV